MQLGQVPQSTWESHIRAHQQFACQHVGTAMPGSCGAHGAGDTGQAMQVSIGFSVLQLPKPKTQHCSASRATVKHRKKKQKLNAECIQTNVGCLNYRHPLCVPLNAAAATAQNIPGPAVPAFLGVFVLDIGLSWVLETSD